MIEPVDGAYTGDKSVLCYTNYLTMLHFYINDKRDNLTISHQLIMYYLNVSCPSSLIFLPLHSFLAFYYLKKGEKKEKKGTENKIKWCSFFFSIALSMRIH